MTIAELRLSIEQMSESELQTEYDQYRTLQARGVRDEIIQELIAIELDRREELV